jgi:hypothetical protein
MLRFDIAADFVQQYDFRAAGADIHQEYRILAEHLGEFNRHIVGAIEVIAIFGSET